MDDENARKKLIQIAKQASGIDKIYTYLRIKKSSYECSHAAIFSSLKTNLFTNQSVEGTAVRLSIVGCDVVFTGVVSNKKQEAHAIYLARHTKGVDNVYSFLQIVD